MGDMLADMGDGRLERRAHYSPLAGRFSRGERDRWGDAHAQRSPEFETDSKTPVDARAPVGGVTREFGAGSPHTYMSPRGPDPGGRGSKEIGPPNQ